MSVIHDPWPATPDQLLAIIRIQTEIAKLGLDFGGVMGLVVDKALVLVEAEGAVIELAEGDDMVYRAASGLAGGQVGLRVSRQSSLSGLCVETGQPMLCNDSENDPRVDLAACRKVGLRSMLVVPLKHDESVVGVLTGSGHRETHVLAKRGELDMVRINASNGLDRLAGFLNS